MESASGIADFGSALIMAFEILEQVNLQINRNVLV